MEPTDFVNYALRHYDNPSCKTIDEFKSDVSRFKYLRKLLWRYSDKQEENFLLMLNHIMVLFNVFEREACVKMLFIKADRRHWSVIKTFLVGLYYMPTAIPDLGVVDSDIPIDEKIANFMRRL